MYKLYVDTKFAVFDSACRNIWPWDGANKPATAEKSVQFWNISTL